MLSLNKVLVVGKVTEDAEKPEGRDATDHGSQKSQNPRAY